MKAYKCNRCGEYFDEEPKNGYSICTIENSHIVFIGLFCPKCSCKFNALAKKFLKLEDDDA